LLLRHSSPSLQWESSRHGTHLSVATLQSSPSSHNPPHGGGNGGSTPSPASSSPGWTGTEASVSIGVCGSSEVTAASRAGSSESSPLVLGPGLLGVFVEDSSWSAEELGTEASGEPVFVPLEQAAAKPNAATSPMYECFMGRGCYWVGVSLQSTYDLQRASTTGCCPRAHHHSEYPRELEIFGYRGPHSSNVTRSNRASSTCYLADTM